MRTTTIAIVAAALLALAAARCPGACSGHGTCGVDDKCTCYKNWQSADCSERVCEYDIAWATNENQGNAHYYAECSGKGICDRATGQCNCFEGYTGNACKRSVCPNDCSGHGKCRLVKELSNANVVGPTTLTALAYNAWDGDKIQACICDGGYTGPDCSQRLCPKGDDPLTICSGSGGPTTQVQTITITYNGDTAANGELLASFDGELALYFHDNEGETWVTNMIPSTVFTAAGTDTTANDDVPEQQISTALRALPNFKIPSVDVTVDDTVTTSATDTRVFAITFTDDSLGGSVSGTQKLFTFDSPLGCQAPGCHPKYKQLRHIETTVVGALAGYTAFTATPPVAADFPISADSVFIAPGTKLTYWARLMIFFQVAEKPSHSYQVHWDVTTTDGGAAPAAGSANFAVNAIPLQPLPDANYDTAVTTTKVNIGNGLFLDLDKDMFFGDTTAAGGFDGALTANDVLSVIFRVNVGTITVSSVDAYANSEDAECSNRGHCDRSTGACTCFEGYYGHSCGLQTVLV